MEWKPNDFEKSLAKAMRRVDAPETLVESVMFRVDAESIAAPTHVSKARHVAPSWWVAPRAWFGAAAFATAALVLLGVVSGERVHQRHLREAEATQQFETATRITDAALQHTRDQLARAGVSLEQ
jgi:hypothetical protein